MARVAYQPDNIYTFISRFLLDEDTFQMRRVEVEGRANFDRWQLTALYGNYDAQPEIGFLERPPGRDRPGHVQVHARTGACSASARYDIEAQQINQHRFGLGYIDDCFAISLNYMTDYNYSGTTTTDNKVLLVINLRTIGGTSFSQGVNRTPARRARTVLTIEASGGATRKAMLSLDAKQTW